MYDTLGSKILNAVDDWRLAHDNLHDGYGQMHWDQLVAFTKEASVAEELADALLCVDVSFGGGYGDIERVKAALIAWTSIVRAPRQ